jgi:two-component system nitrogen regulation response regulator GlnG
MKGAFTGAIEQHVGLFERANGGTLFLDEIGEAPVEVQVMLLRVLEAGTILPIGGRAEKRIDVRLIAATDADLEKASQNGNFRTALFHRLAVFDIHLPPLRARIDDLGRLFFHFLREELGAFGEEHRLSATGEEVEPFVPASLIARLAQQSWPGNVRQLRNVVRQLVISGRNARILEPGANLERMLRTSAESADPVALAGEPRPEPSRKRKPAEITEDELIEALRAHRWRLEPAAKTLGISRPSIYVLIDRCERLRKAKDIPEEELTRLYEELNGDVEAMAGQLEVSSRGLQRRLKEIFPQ